ncbi:MAG: AzlC family ABC transporter permease [Desulfobacterales bacterium]|nr:AzlC family ABC transporter permease [Desulfobacterales bacterium]
MMNAFRRGALANLPVAASVVAYGAVLGVLAAKQQIAWHSLLLMNLSVFAGSAQFVMVEMWLPPLPVLEMVLGVLVINMRYLLIGASLRPLFSGCPLWQKALGMHLVADENWAVTMAAYRRGQASIAYLMGGGVCLLTVWCLGTLAGHHLGAFISRPEAFGLDFAFVAVFTALLVGFWRDRSDWLPWCAAAGLALLTHQLLPGKWYIITGGMGGALLKVWQSRSALPNASRVDEPPNES